MIRARSPWSDPLENLPLRQGTPPQWVEIALERIDEVLVDHAFCEHKAASMALAVIVRFPGNTPLVRAMEALAREEMRHFRMVLDRVEERGGHLGPPRHDRYVSELRRASCSTGEGIGALGDLLLAAAFIEARSCERFRLLADALVGEAGEHRGLDDLGEFYRRLADAEGRHWEMFRDLTLELCPPKRARRRLEEVAEMEAAIVRRLPLGPRMH